jgi:hypothetical protein
MFLPPVTIRMSKQIDNLVQRFDNIIANFDRGIAVQTFQTVEKINQTTNHIGIKTFFIGLFMVLIVLLQEITIRSKSCLSLVYITRSLSNSRKANNQKY